MKRYVLTLSKDLRQGNKLFTDNKADFDGKKFVSISLKRVKDVVAGDTLYISSHGVWDTKKGVAVATNELQNEAGFETPEQLFEALRDNGLKNVGMKLKIFACFSGGMPTAAGAQPSDTNINGSFAGQLKSILREKGFGQIIVFGYFGETMFGNQSGLGGHKVGGIHPIAGPVAGNVQPRASDRRVIFNPDDSKDVIWQ